MQSQPYGVDTAVKPIKTNYNDISIENRRINNDFQPLLCSHKLNKKKPSTSSKKNQLFVIWK